ncbi:DMT family transporter [Granulicella cerasi]|uniref:DMT family transporter n=1 Tax=Granulicella cerasi TaxID=741063 RepID=A0ABW1Z5A8_9BACT|nr:DMT family transporter [Granulicella cerasi]
MTPRRTSLTAHILLALVTLVWGTTFALVKVALHDATPLAFNLARMTLAFLALAVINFDSLRTLTRFDLVGGASAGLFLALGYQFQTAGLAHTTAAKSAFITGLVVVIVPLLATIPALAPPNHRKPGFAALLGAIIAFAGLVLLTTPPGSGAAVFSGLHRGEWLSLCCSFAYGLHLLTIARFAHRSSARKLGTLQIGFAALVMAITLPLGGKPMLHLTPIVIVALLVTALLATAAAFTIQSWAQQHLPATHTALIFTLEPIFAWLFSLLFLGEHLSTRSLTGAALILAGILFAELAAATSGENSDILPTTGT